MFVKYSQDHEISMGTFCWKNVPSFLQVQAQISILLFFEWFLTGRIARISILIHYNTTNLTNSDIFLEV
jgi:hypothetical protein